ncbi:TetR-like C-terminal domain-containing protein [Nocardioides sp. CFH 31398]|uniref:TetR-like C-terminal domain-containing protein n=1 Tax=Nocardioides sp. CFH 31398 TaxID=2919579 RepID=UPI001F05DB75|nr:TetR-like C-terminal domain-containing protein [Nocardioides sp. CFH 31398]MCH1867880.1 WHG domain-containing protein [Nocardioides sp. CFH 31398]
MSQQQLPRTRPSSAGPEVRPVPEEGAATRLEVVARVVAAARSELCQRHQLSLRAVARRAGVGIREVAQHVGTGDELIGRIFFEMAVDAHEVMAGVSQASADSSTRDRLLAYARGYRHWALTRPVEFSLLLGPTARALMDESVAAQGVTWFNGPLIDILRDGAERGQVDLDSGAAAGRSLPAVRPGLLAAAQDLDPRTALAFVTVSAGLHGHLVLEGSGQLAAVFVDLDRAFDAHMRAVLDAAGIA